MQHNVKSLIGFTMGATDGEIGKVCNFYFDDVTWIVRYIIVKTGGWLSERKLLISPAALTEPNWENKTFPAGLTRKQIENSPDIDTEKPISRLQELSLYNHYSWPYGPLTGTGFYGGIGMVGMVESRIPFEDSIAAQNTASFSGNPHLQSTGNVKGYRLHAVDGEIGAVEDFIIDDTAWGIRFLVVDTGHWLPGKKVLISPKWIKEVKWKDSSVYVNLPVDAVKHSPKYDASKPVHPTYESDLHNHYGTEE